MPATGVELATAWVRLVPSLDGVQGEVAKAFGPAEAEANKAGQKAGKGFSTSTKAALTAGAAVVVAGVVAGFKGLYEIGNTFDNVTDTIRVGTGAQGDALNSLVDVAKNVGKQVPAEFDKIGTTVADLNTRLGLTGTDLEHVAKQVLEAGRILGQDIDIARTTAAFTAFGIEGEYVSGAMDTLFQISQATGVGMNELAAGATRMAPAMQTLGFSFEDTASMVGTFDKAGLDSNAIMASMSKGMIELAKDGEQPAEAYKRVVGELQGFVDTGDKAAALDLASEIFGTRGAAQFVGALESGVLNMDDLMAATGATGDTILGVGEETMDFAERWTILMNEAMVAIEPLADAVFTAIGDGLQFAMPLLTEFGAFLSENTWVMPVLAAAVGVVTVAIIAATAAMWALSLTPVVATILLIIAGVALLVTAIVIMVANWDKVVSFFQDVWANVVNWFTGTLDSIGAWWTSLWTEVGNFFTTIWTSITRFFRGLWDGLVGWWNGIVSGIANILLNTLNNIASFWNSIWTGIVSFFTGLWNNVVSFVGGVMGGIRGAIDNALNFISSAWHGMWGGMVDFFGTVFGGIVGIAKAPINGVISLVNGAIRALNNFKVTVPDWVPGIGGSTFGFSIPTIPMLALGGTITSTGYAIVGENGPEVLKLPKGAQVNPDYDDLPDGGGVTFNNYAPLGQSPAQALSQFANRAKGL